MTNAWLVGASVSIPQDETQVRTTLDPVRTLTDSESAEQTGSPEWNSFDTDESGALLGPITHRVAGSNTVDEESYTPFWLALSQVHPNHIVNEQVASSGTAAERESAGEQGHGTMQYALGIEPVIRDGAAFGSDYFVTHDLPVQDGMGAYMSPADQDNWLSSVAQVRATSASRAAFSSSLYSDFMQGG